MRAQRKLRGRAVPQVRGACQGQVGGEPLFLLQLPANDRAGCRGQLGLVVVTPDRRGGAAVQKRGGAARQDRRRHVRVDPCPCAGEQHFLDVALSERSLPRGDLDDRRAMLRTLCRPDRQRDAESGEAPKSHQDRSDRTPPPGGERPELRAPQHR